MQTTNTATSHLHSIVKKNAERLNVELTPDTLFVSIPQQKLFHFRNGELHKEYTVSTSKRPPSCIANSLGTPNGLHQIAQKIGEGEPEGMVFIGRRPKVIYQEYDKPLLGMENLITSRILWLEGLEYGLNKGPGCDTFKRYIYIHASQNDHKIGTPISSGCIQLTNKDVIELFENVPENTLIWIDLEN